MEGSLIRWILKHCIADIFEGTKYSIANNARNSNEKCIKISD